MKCLPLTSASFYTGNLEPEACPSGYYCPEGTPNPVACPSGTYQPNTAAGSDDACTPCMPGMSHRIGYHVGSYLLLIFTSTDQATRKSFLMRSSKGKIRSFIDKLSTFKGTLRK